MIEFQIVDIIGDDIEEHCEDYHKCFFITLYGKTKNNQSIICNVSKFRPFFYVKIPNDWHNNNTKIKKFLNINIKTRMPFDSDIKGICHAEYLSRYNVSDSYLAGCQSGVFKASKLCHEVSASGP